VLIIPNAAAFEPADLTTLLAWVQSDGGSLIITGDSGSRLGESSNFDTVSNLVLAPLTGITNYTAAPPAFTNRLGAGVVRFVKANLGRSYYDASAGGRVALRPSLAAVINDGFNLGGAQPVITSSNAPVTVGLTLYADPTVPRIFIDLNNLNVDGSTFAATPTPVLDVDLHRPPWLTNAPPLQVTGISPDGPVTVSPPQIDSGGIHVQFPSVTNYLSVILQPVHRLWLGSPSILSNAVFQAVVGYADGVPIVAEQLSNYDALVSSNLLDWTKLPNALSWSNSLLLLSDLQPSNAQCRYYRLIEH
jgi:hypothetical protein